MRARSLLAGPRKCRRKRNRNVTKLSAGRPRAMNFVHVIQRNFPTPTFRPVGEYTQYRTLGNGLKLCGTQAPATNREPEVRHMPVTYCIDRAKRVIYTK